MLQNLHFWDAILNYGLAIDDISFSIAYSFLAMSKAPESMPFFLPRRIFEVSDFFWAPSWIAKEAHRLFVSIFDSMLLAPQST